MFRITSEGGLSSSIVLVTKIEYDRLTGKLSQTNAPYLVRRQIEQVSKHTRRRINLASFAKHLLFRANITDAIFSYTHFYLINYNGV
ncbi:MAG: hypothetical protein ACKO96_15915, partial [Flammeovirgaceae bacterium]